ncbi:MAG TPA: autotransporter-associated beta strand repeat-containing protein, partial [Phycisphaerae bacterium]|nr:autotransporter-associated beta strand repeat-containing protein [Phycisphaerae bacterium]
MPRISPNCQKAVLAFAALLAASPRFAAASVVGQWNLNAGGFWSSAASWAGGLIPDAPGDAAIFGPILADPAGATISLDGNRVLSSLTFNSTAGSYFLSSTSAGSLLFQSTTASTTPGINVIAGQHRLDIPVLASGNLLVNMTGSPSMPTQLAITRVIQSAGSVTLNGTNASISDFVFTGSTSGITGSVIAMGTANGVTRVTVDGANLQSSYDQPSLGSIKIGAGDGSSTYLKLISGRIATTGWGEMWLGERSSNSSFTALSMTGGTITVANSFLVVGNGNDRAIFNMSGGQTSTSVMTLGTGYDPVNPDSIGVANISGGTLTALTSIGSYTGIYAGEIGSGVLNISGSAVVAASTIQYGNIYKYPSVSGIVNLLGGTLTAGIFKMASTLSIGSFVNFNGGVLRPLGSTTTFMSGLNGAYVYQNGAVIDDGGYAVTISQPLLAPTGNGVAAISVSGGTGYIDTPMVLISRGAGDSTGAGAAAIANVDSSGHLTGITITNPGVGYTTTPVVTLVGGSGLGALVGSLTLSPSASGGLTKRGNGTLTLSATETYTGPTIVNSGVLVVSGALNAASSVTVQGGAGLRGTGTVAGPVTLAAGPTPDTQGSIASNTQPEMFMLLGGLTAGGTAGSASVLNFDIGGPATGNDLLVLQNSPFTVNPGGAVIRLNNLGNIVPGTYILMGFNNATAPSNVSLDTSTLGLYNATLNVSSTAISVTIGGHAYPAKAYWTGAYSNKWNGAGGPGLDQANFVSAASGGTNTLQVPGPSTDVFFAPGLSNTLNTNLGQNMMIRSLTISPGTGAVTIGGPGYLQLTGGVLSVASDSSLVVNTDVILANTQTWTNSNPGAVLQINGKDLLTTGVSFTASGNFQLNSDWSNFGGTLTVAAGTFQLANGGIIGPTIVDNGTFVVSSLNSIDTTGTFRYNITGFGNVVFDIPGDILHFQSANNYAGQTTLESGTLTLEGTVLPFSPKITVMADATLVSYISLSKNLSGTGTVAFNLFQSDLSLTGAWDFAGTITSTRDAFYNSRLIFSGTNSHSVGIVTGSGSLQIAANSALTSDGITLDNLIVSGTHTIRPNPLDTGTSKLNSLALAAATTGSFTATLNLNNNKLILQSTDDAD